MSIRIVVASLSTLVLCLGASSPSESLAGGGAAAFASLTPVPGDPARELVRYGETSAAYEFFRDRRVVRSADEVRFEARLLAELGRFAEAESTLAEYPPLEDQRDVSLHYLWRSALDLLAGRNERALDAIAMVDSSAGGVPGLAAYRDYIELRASLALSRPDDAVRAGNRARARGIPDALEVEFDEAMVQALDESGESSRAIELTHELQRKARGWERKGALIYREYELYARARRVDDARRVALDLVTTYPRIGQVPDVVNEIVASLGAPGLSEEELVAYAGYFTRTEAFAEARRLLTELGRRALSPDQREQLRLLNADFYYRSGQYTKAIELARPSYTNPSYKRQSMLILARSYRRSGNEREAAELYEYFSKAFPNDDKTAEALFVAAHIYDRLDDEPAVDRVLETLMKSYPSSYYGHTAALMAADRHTRRGEHGGAVEVLSRLTRRTRGTDEAALYYLSRAYESAGDESNKTLILGQLRDFDANSFYLNPSVPSRFRGPVTNSSGALAMEGSDGLLEFLGRGEREKNAAYRRIRLELAPGDDRGFASGEYDECLERGRWLLGAGLRTWGEAELDAARRRCYDSPGRILELASVFDEFAMPWRSVGLYQRARDRMPWKRRGAFAEDFLWLLYPTPYPLQVLENAARYGVAPHLAYAMIREESRFDVGAVSHVGALGLMQIMPETGRWVAGELELPGWVESDLLDPEINVAFGVWYASSLLREADGDPVWMLAAYNAGLGNAQRWFDASSATDAIRAVDNIDFKETRQYVQRIVESANIYHSLYFAPDSSGEAR